MGTTDPDKERVRGYVQLTDRVMEIVEDVTYGDQKKRRALWPLVLLAVATIALLAGGASAPLPVGVMGLLSLVLLGVWVGGSGR